MASRLPERAQAIAAKHGGVAVAGYDALLDQPEVEAVYIPLVNSLHREWTLRALAAGKHVLCEKPLALTEREAMEMEVAAGAAGKLLMEAFMYRLDPRMRAFHESARDPIHVSAAFGFPLTAPGNYRLDPALGGGALLDTGCYCVSVARWLLGEPDRVEAVAHIAGVDLTVAASLSFPGGATAAAWCSFESPEHQEVLVVMPEHVARLDRPFTAWNDPDDPYRLMVEAFGDSAIRGQALPIPVSESIANLRVLDQIRAAISSPPSARL